MLRHFPPGAVGAEIGVAQGAFAAEILAAASPSALHLVDPWSHVEPGSGLLDGGGLLAGIEAAGGCGLEPPPFNAAGDAEFEAVAARFAGDSRVRLHRQYSYRIAPTFAPGMFDFVYLDGNHHYEFVLRDLQDFASTLKPGGLLFGHDHFEDAFAAREHYGVVEAVATFLKRSDFRFLMLTWEPFSTFCLARSLDGFAGAVLRNLLDGEVPMVELPDSIAADHRDLAWPRRDGSVRRIPSFSVGSGPEWPATL